MKVRYPAVIVIILLAFTGSLAVLAQAPKISGKALDVAPPHFKKDGSVKIDYDIVYVRAPRSDKGSRWGEAGRPTTMAAGSDLMLLHPDGQEELLVAGGAGAVADPYVSFDGESVYFAKFPEMPAQGQQATYPKGGSDIFKIHVKTRKISQLTKQEFTPNLGVMKAAPPSKGEANRRVFNLGPCPIPGGKVMFTSTRNGFDPPRAWGGVPTLQLFIMDDDGSNVECVGHLNLGCALHPTILRDGRVLFSTLESQGMRDIRLWGLWSIHPDGTNWGPVVSAFETPKVFHFQTQLSNGRIIVEDYYNLNNQGFGTYYSVPEQPPADAPPFGPGDRKDPRNRFAQGTLGRINPLPFAPVGIEAVTRFCDSNDNPAAPSVPGDETSLRVGKVTHPSGAPDNHLLTVWSPGPANYHYPMDLAKTPQRYIDGGIYLIKGGKPIDEPGQMLLIKNDPKYDEQWPRALVPYQRIYGVDQPKQLVHKNEGKLSAHLPEGTPFGLVGTSSFYKRDSAAGGSVAPGTVTAVTKIAGGGAASQAFGGGEGNWKNQGADAGRYANSDIHAVRILVMEPATDFGPRGRHFYNHANERLRVLGEIPLRKFNDSGKQPLDPDGNPDTSFLAKIPADAVFTFQTLDKHGMVLNASQTWHQVRPGEIRNDCGGCHAHSQKPTLFEKTAAAKSDYQVWDLTERTPLLTTKKTDESGKRWDEKGATGVRYHKGVVNVEYHRDIRPILDRSCVACHASTAKSIPGNLALDNDTLINGDARQNLLRRPVPEAYYRLAMDEYARFGHKGLGDKGGYGGQYGSRYVMMFQSRRSLLIWKVFGQRLDGWSNDDYASETVPGDPTSVRLKGKPVAQAELKKLGHDLDYLGTAMPPPDAVASGKVKPLSDEDKLTLVRWIDLGCPIDLDYDASAPSKTGIGWLCDEARPTLTLTYPQPGKNAELSRIMVGMHDYYTGLVADSFEVIADFPVDGLPAGKNLASKFKPTTAGVWELQLAKPIQSLPKGKLTVSVKDKQGNLTKIERTFSVGPVAAAAAGGIRIKTAD